MASETFHGISQKLSSEIAESVGGVVLVLGLLSVLTDLLDKS